MNKLELNISYNVYQSSGELDPAISNLTAKAEEASERAYAPYSKFNVGAAVLLASGEIVTGNNQENAAYPSGLCAERVAIFAASAVNPGMEVRAIAVFAKGEHSSFEDPVTPCGACRQVMLEYENRQKTMIPVYMKGINGKIIEAPSVKSLLPLAFGSFQLTGQ